MREEIVQHLEVGDRVRVTEELPNDQVASTIGLLGTVVEYRVKGSYVKVKVDELPVAFLFEPSELVYVPPTPAPLEAAEGSK